GGGARGPGFGGRGGRGPRAAPPTRATSTPPPAGGRPRRSASTRRRMPIPQIHAATSPRRSHRPADRQTATNVSCTTSSTSSADEHRRPRRTNSHGGCRRYSSANASLSPAVIAARSWESSRGSGGRVSMRDLPAPTRPNDRGSSHPHLVRRTERGERFTGPVGDRHG